MSSPSTALRRVEPPRGLSPAAQPGGSAGSSSVSVFDHFPTEQLDVIRRTIAKDATDEELYLFLYQAHRTGLDPLSRQIHLVGRYDSRQKRKVHTIQTSIDGYRLIADRTGLYAGSDDYRFDEGLTEYEHVQTGRGNPTTATVTVYKVVHGTRVPFAATARWEEYFPGESQGFMWKKMPYLMLGKCAEALALRKAFPAELSGLYTHEEMEQAGGRAPLVEVETAEAETADWQQHDTSQLPHNVKQRQAETLATVRDLCARVTPRHWNALVEHVAKVTEGWELADRAEVDALVEDAERRTKSAAATALAAVLRQVAADHASGAAPEEMDAAVEDVLGGWPEAWADHARRALTLVYRGVPVRDAITQAGKAQTEQQ